MAGLSDGHLLSMISRQVRILIGIRQALDSGLSSHEITSLLKLHPFVLQKGINQVRNFNLETLKKIFFRLVEIDKDMKTGRADARTALNILFSKI
jgi:DNA polymerase-3 subunit delta